MFHFYRHYHSMKVFARYEVINHEHRTVASGMKASFCLEDNYCVRGVHKYFRCSTERSIMGEQGRTPFSSIVSRFFNEFVIQIFRLLFYQSK